MNRIRKAQACFKELGFDFDISRFESRLIAQKTVYLLQELGVDMGYDYNFYIRGTYSPGLTRDLFETPEGEGETILDEDDQKAIKRFQEVVDLRPHLLEVMAAYRFLRRQGRSQDKAVSLIKTAKPFISERDIAIGISKCKTIFPEVTEGDIVSLQEEIDPWEQAASEDEL